MERKRLVTAASDQRMDAAGAASASAGAWAAVFDDLNDRAGFRQRKPIKAGCWQGGGRGNADRANEDRRKNVTHLVTPSSQSGHAKA